MTKRPLDPKRRKPAKFSERTALKLLDGLAAGKTLAELGRQKGMPHPASVSRWIRENPEFAEAVKEARRVGAGAQADQLVAMTHELVDRARDGKLQPGEVAAVREHSNTLRWFLSRWAPSEFGEKPAPQTQVVVNTSLGAESSGPVHGGPYEVTVETTDGVPDSK
ncbi:hypothetical protein ACFOW6_17785 [Fodinicurvata halophila]|uniref:Terminase small subunit n=1 Tax=Fodinicurvata halophila TaxID=1419723 RepID=A0ABV8USF2_9PROT